MSNRASEGFWFGEVRSVTVDVQDHVAGGVANCHVRVCGGIIEQPQGFLFVEISGSGFVFCHRAHHIAHNFGQGEKWAIGGRG